MNRLNVLLVTTSPPTRTLGGPGRFVPMLIESLGPGSPGAEKARVLAYMDDQLYADPKSFVWADAPSARPRESLSRRLYHALTLPSMVRGKIAGRQFAERVRQIVREQGIDLVHAHDFWSVHHLAPGVEVPLVFTNHFKGSFYREFLAPTYPHLRGKAWKAYYTRIERGAIRRAETLVFPSFSAQDLLIRDYPDKEQEITGKARVIYNGLPAGTSAPLQRPGPAGERSVVLNVANHVPDKGIEVALRVFKHLFADHPLRFVNIGELGPLTPELRGLVARLGLSDRAEFLGRKPREEVLARMAKATLVLHTPERVVFDLSLLEAMALGKPAVVSDVRGNREAVGPDYPFVLDPGGFPEGGDPKAPEWASLLFLESERRKWGTYLRDRFLKHFTIERMIKGYLDLWSESGVRAG